jgi:hypothetical protein
MAGMWHIAACNMSIALFYGAHKRIPNKKKPEILQTKNKPWHGKSETKKCRRLSWEAY